MKAEGGVRVIKELSEFSFSRDETMESLLMESSISKGTASTGSSGSRFLIKDFKIKNIRLMDTGSLS